MMNKELILDCGEFQLTIAIDFAPVKGIAGDDEPSLLNVQIRLTNERQQKTLSTARQVSVWSDEIFDMLDLSICMDHISEREDTTESLECRYRPKKSGEQGGSSKPAYSYSAQWVLYQSLFGVDFAMSAKNTPRFIGRRYISMFFYDVDDESRVMVEAIDCTPQSLNTFSRELFQCYEELQESISRL